MGATPGWKCHMNTNNSELKNLTELAKKLNQSGDSIKRILDDVQDKLRATEIELEFWLPERIEEVGRKGPYNDVSRCDGADPNIVMNRPGFSGDSFS